jgi:tRNA(fMet)-specific endonuclease VapC
MSVFVLDTDHVTLYHTGNPQVLQNIALHAADTLTICVITVEEQLTGWQTALRQAKDDARREQVYRRMALAVESLSGWLVIPFTHSAMLRHRALLRLHRNVGSNDLKIAAVAIEFNATVITRNQRDFRQVAGLTLADWSV